ncbi:MAG: hypothetical protein IT324_13080 [Anaerolineae bacterium]|nr:hypothetical protein [Anaerolineae bacterium]
MSNLSRIPWYVVALVAYYLPWVYHPAAGLTFNAYDLAEWVSLHPAVRGASVPLVAPFLLRVVLGGLALLFCLRALRSARTWVRLAYAGLAVLLAITLLPPFDFFRGAWDDPNYRQQFTLSIGTLVGLVALTAINRRGKIAANGTTSDKYPYREVRPLEIVVSLLTAIGAVGGEILALNVIRSLQIDVSVGGGIIVLLSCLIAAQYRPRPQREESALP